MKKRTVWLSYDLGVRGDYEGLYTWLDGHRARECGSGLALVTYEYKNDLLKELKADLKRAVGLTKRARIYVVHDDPASEKVKGTFLFGGRKPAAWAGFAGGEPAEDVDEG